MEKHALFPGSFDPFTLGHQSVVERALNVFDKITIGIGVNSKKQYLFDLESRKAHIAEVFAGDSRVMIQAYEGLTVDFCKKHGIKCIVRGIRNTRDFLFENEIAGMNHSLNEEIETLFLASYPEHSMINASIVREIYKNGGDISSFMPQGVDLPSPSS